MWLSETGRSRLLDFARESIRRSLSPPIATAAILQTPPGESELHQFGGCFVTLHELGSRRLRGCVGRTDASQPLWCAVQQSAESCLTDPRFATDPVTFHELHNLEIEITVLSPLVRARDVNDFDPMTHGLYLTISGRSGCFLPQVARETGWSREQLLDRLCTEKLELEPNAWQDPAAVLERFTAVIVGPAAFDDRTDV